MDNGEKAGGAEAEEMALLGAVPVNNMDDIELRPVEFHFPSSLLQDSCSRVRIRTHYGEILVVVQGHRSKPAIITYHDIGLNYLSFQPFFNYADMRLLLENFCVYHVNAPGQEEYAFRLPNNYTYPTVNELAAQINFVIGYFGIRSFIGMGVGSGANILARYALMHPLRVDALVLINCTASMAGWFEWGYQLVNSRTLRIRGMTDLVVDYLMWYHFGKSLQIRNPDVYRMYRAFFKQMNPNNLAMFIEEYVRRPDLGISREYETIKVPVMNITGALSPHVNSTVSFNGRLNPNNSTWIKISDCGSILEERPGKFSEALRLFLQGEGFVAPLSPTKIVGFRRRKPCRHSSIIRITENPISEAVVC